MQAKPPPAPAQTPRRLACSAALFSAWLLRTLVAAPLSVLSLLLRVSFRLLLVALLLAAPLWMLATFAPADSGRLHLAGRAVHLLGAHLPTLAAAPLAVPSRAWREAIFFPALVRGIERSGAAYVKWGQWASTRPDLLPVELCAELSHLTAGAPSHPFHVTRAAVEAAVGATLEEAFETFEVHHCNYHRNCNRH